jgi:WD40 repeat protein
MPDGSVFLATADRDAAIRLWDPVAGRLLHTLSPDGGEMTALAVAAPTNGVTIVASACHDDNGRIRLWNAADGRLIETLESNRLPALALAFGTLADGSLVLADAGIGGTICLWDPETGKAARELRKHTDWVRCLALGLLTAARSSQAQATMPRYGPGIRAPARIRGRSPNRQVAGSSR